MGLEISSKAMQSIFIEITLWHGCSPVNLLHILRTPFFRNTSGWLLLSVSSGYSNNSCSDMNILFREMFSDSKIAQDFAMSENKLRDTVSYVKSSECLVVSFCESLNSKTQECQLELVIRFL